ncbi:hypothetical protein H9X57_10830 [Flavobacterium piscinae]|uniref:hypothetical protein n=1 Tax=Flavobacterium piscinae TaxID=2506424 RepID=UPI0019B82447|nr:hypothetical protein [Flavobacterium piscinae]MBC8883682.1 hypothetical protein [Flavobacterium piscinae]
MSNKHNVNNLQKNYSSGSSGVQSYAYTDKKYKFYIQGIHSHWYMWSGYKIGDPILQFGMSPNRVFPKNLKDIFYNVHYLNSFSLNESKLLEVRLFYKKIRLNILLDIPQQLMSLQEY